MAKIPTPEQKIETIEIEPRAWTAFKLREGESMRLIDVEGQQVGDLIAVNDADPDERLSCLFSQVATGRWRLRPGDAYYTSLSRPMLEVVEDTVGVHHQLGGFCTPESNEQRYGVPDTPCCYTNFLGAMAEHGLGPAHIQPDMCTSLFMNVVLDADGSMRIAEPVSRAGDSITLKALMDVRIAISNCPQERNPCNAFNPTRLRVELFETD
ncbi:MAG: urea carboxylase-associated family protein [Actinobacteria bacterium]|nr:urea carboxylase-associated family protein [Actinomycetota bacterium]